MLKIKKLFYFVVYCSCSNQTKEASAVVEDPSLDHGNKSNPHQPWYTAPWLGRQNTYIFFLIDLT